MTAPGAVRIMGQPGTALRLLIVLGWLAWSGTASACPGEAGFCEVEGGSYMVLLPSAGQDGPPPVLLHLHGWGGNAAAVLQAGFTQEFLAHGFAVIAPQGLQPRSGGRTDWSVEDGQPHLRDDRAFVGRVLDDAARRFGLDRGRVLLSGFSRGGSMAWDIACQQPGLALAYAPVAGGFWQPEPAACTGPVRLLHTHGFADATVPLEGRELRGGALAQADIFAGLALWRRVDGCDGPAEVLDAAGLFWRKRWTGCRAGMVELALHPGGHAIPDGWAGLAIDWFLALPRRPGGTG